MTITSRILAVAATSGALLAATAPAHAADGPDVLNVVNAKRIPVSVASEGNTSADNIQISDVEQDDPVRGPLLENSSTPTRSTTV